MHVYSIPINLKNTRTPNNLAHSNKPSPQSLAASTDAARMDLTVTSPTTLSATTAPLLHSILIRPSLAGWPVQSNQGTFHITILVCFSLQIVFAKLLACKTQSLPIVTFPYNCSGFSNHMMPKIHAIYQCNVRKFTETYNVFSKPYYRILSLFTAVLVSCTLSNVAVSIIINHMTICPILNEAI